MLGETLKKSFADARIGHQEAADGLGISKANLYNLFKKDSFEIDYLRRASEITGIPLSEFLGQESSIVDQKQRGEGKYTGQAINKVSKGIEELKSLFEEELRMKNQQIASLQEMLKMVLGKFEGAIVEPLFCGDDAFDEAFNEYRSRIMGTFSPIDAIRSLIPEQKLVAPRSHSHPMGKRLQ